MDLLDRVLVSTRRRPRCPPGCPGGQQQRGPSPALAMRLEGHAVRRADRADPEWSTRRRTRWSSFAREGMTMILGVTTRRVSRQGIRPHRVHGRRQILEENTPVEFSPSEDRTCQGLPRRFTHRLVATHMTVIQHLFRIRRIARRASRCRRRVACTMSLAACGADEKSGKIRIGIVFDSARLGFKKSEHTSA